MLTRKAAQNFKVQMPEKKPSLGRKKQGPFFRKRVMVKDATRYALVSAGLLRGRLEVEWKKAGSTKLKYKRTKREGKASM